MPNKQQIRQRAKQLGIKVTKDGKAKTKVQLEADIQEHHLNNELAEFEANNPLPEAQAKPAVTTSKSQPKQEKAWYEFW